MKKIINIAGSMFNAAEISAVYTIATDKTDGNYETLYEVHIVIDGVDIVVCTAIATIAREFRDRITNIIAANAEIIKI